MTRAANNPNDFTPFSHWLRALPDPLSSRVISNQNLDYIWHNYRESWLITIEEKRHGGSVPPAQQDTHYIIEQMLTASSGLRVQTLRGIRPIEYRGHYVIRFENTTPDDGRIWINDTQATKHDLLRLLSGGKTPLTLVA